MSTCVSRGGGRLLATVMCLPLLDGVFPALVLAGALSDPLGVAEVGLLVFGGGATVGVVLSEMDGSVRQRSVTILGVGVVLVAGAVLEAAAAPTFRITYSSTSDDTSPSTSAERNISDGTRGSESADRSCSSSCHSHRRHFG